MVELVLAFVGSLCAGVLFNVNKKNLLWIGLSGMCGWLVFAWMNVVAREAMLATFFGAVAVSLYSEIMARVLKSPATVFSVSGIFPIVPGIPAYNAVQYIVENRLPEAAAKVVQTMGSAGAIAFGILLVTAVFRFASRLKQMCSSKMS